MSFSRPIQLYHSHVDPIWAAVPLLYFYPILRNFDDFPRRLVFTLASTFLYAWWCSKKIYRPTIS